MVVNVGWAGSFNKGAGSGGWAFGFSQVAFGGAGAGILVVVGFIGTLGNTAGAPGDVPEACTTTGPPPIPAISKMSCPELPAVSRICIRIATGPEPGNRNRVEPFSSGSIGTVYHCCVGSSR